MYEAGFCGFWIHERLTALGIDNIVVNPADVPTKSQRTERHLYAGQCIVGNAFLDKIEELDHQRHDPSEEPDQVPVTVFRHRDSAGVPRTFLQLIETLFRMAERG